MFDEEMIEAAPPDTAPEETPEERDARLKREDFQRRNLHAMDEYEKIVGSPHPSRNDPDAAVSQRCCF